MLRVCCSDHRAAAVVEVNIELVVVVEELTDDISFGVADITSTARLWW